MPVATSTLFVFTLNRAIIKQYFFNGHYVIQWRGRPVVVEVRFVWCLCTFRPARDLSWTVFNCEDQRPDLLRRFFILLNVLHCRSPKLRVLHSLSRYRRGLLHLASIFFLHFRRGSPYLLYCLQYRACRFPSRCVMNRFCRWFGIYSHCGWRRGFYGLTLHHRTKSTEVEVNPLQLGVTTLCLRCGVSPVDMTAEA